MESEWKTMSLEDCMDAIIDYRGKTPNKTSSGIPFITAKIGKNGQILPPQEFIAEDDYDTWMHRGLPESGDVVMTTEAPLGEIAQLDNCKVALAQCLITLRGKRNVLDNTFLKYLMRSSGVQVVGIDDSFQQVCQQACDARKATEIYNNTIETLNKRIQEIKDSTAAGNINETENALLHLETVKKRYAPQVMTVVEDYKETKKVKETLEEEKTRAKEELDQHSETVMVEYQEEINKLFDRFNTEFRITKTGRDYRGGMPRSKYQLCINDTTVGLDGDDRQPCFKNTLSSGDRSTLALAFFVTKLEQDPDIERKIVVLDDPFTSLDRFRRNCNRDIILKLARKAEQIIVFSHDLLFLKIVYDQLPSGNVKTLQLSKIGKSAIITEWVSKRKRRSDTLRIMMIWWRSFLMAQVWVTYSVLQGRFGM